MIRLFRHLWILTIILLVQCGDDPAIQFPALQDPPYVTRTNYTFDGNISSARAGVSGPATDVPDPSFITRTNYNFDGNILSLYLTGSFVNDGQSTSIATLVDGVVLNDYDYSTDGTGFTKGFFIQDQNAAIFVRRLPGIAVRRGDKLRLVATTLYRSSCSSCGLNERGRLQITTYTILTTLSTGSLLYCQDINPPTSNVNPPLGPVLTKIKGTVSAKSGNPASWGMDSDTWSIYIPHSYERSFSSITVGSEVIAFGMVESYSSSLAGGAVTNRYALWIFQTANSIYNLSGAAVNTVEGIVINQYNTTTSGTYFNGFFIQDQNAGIFVRNTDTANPIDVRRGDRVQINVREYRTDSVTGQIQIYNPIQGDIIILSREHSIYCMDITSPTSPTNTPEGPRFVRLKGVVSVKTSNNPATWGIDSNSWGVRIPVATDRDLPDVLVGDEVMVYGVVESYSPQIASGAVGNHYPLWLFSTKDSLYDLSIIQ